MATSPDHQTIIIGAGFSGIGTAIALDRAGMRDWLVVDDGDDVGGTWHWNTYPGVAVDIPSFSYQYSFEQSSRWSRVYAPGTELRGYAQHVTEKYGLRDRMRFGVRVTSAAFDEDADLWRLQMREGVELTARYVVAATGVLTQPKPPEIDGLDAFAGTTVHTARWDHDLDLTGKRVAIIGTGASAVQVIPAIAQEVADLTVFQRTPIWCLPKPDAAMPGPIRQVLRRVPGGRQVLRALSQAYVEVTFPLAAHYARVLPLAAASETLARLHLRTQVKDPEVRAKLTPSYAMGCKRPSFHNEYLATFNRANVHLETNPITHVSATGVHTADGAAHDVDVLILATGFKVFESGNMPPFDVAGRDGVDLESWWDENRFQAYQGVSVPGFPNMFTILGPYGYNGSSYFTLIENSSRHIVRLLRRAGTQGATRVEVTAEANARYHADMLKARPRQVFFQDSCAVANSYYFDKHGDVPFRPTTTLEAAWSSGHFDLGDYTFTSVGDRATVPA